jgi:hypothetical protein
MGWQIIVALVVAIPLMLLPVAFVWYLNIAPLYKAYRERSRKAVIQNQEIRG